MNLIRYFLFTFIIVPYCSRGQITITSADLPFANDTFRVSNAAVTTPVDLTLTGANYTWDFSTLAPVSQTVDSFIPLSSTGLIYAFFFALGQNASNLVQKGPTLPSIPNFSVSNVFAFYNRGTNSFRQVGLGAELNGIQTPMAFTNQDTIYHLPVHFNDQDSCDSDYGISLTGLGAYAATQKRVNHVDGWGTLITPFGTFNTLRVVTQMTGHDSLYLDSLSMGFSAPRPLTKEYKWLANGEGIPVLQINTQVLGPVETVTAIRYKDSLYATGVNTVSASRHGISIFPNPSADQALLKADYAGAANVELLLTDLSGRAKGKVFVKSEELRAGVELGRCFGNIPEGIYLVHLRGNESTELVRWIKGR